MVLLGGPVSVVSHDPYELVEAHRRFGYQAAYCPQIAPSDHDRIRAVRDAFAQGGIVLAECNAWCRLISPDQAESQRHIQRVTEHLAVADEVGGLCTVDFLGTWDAGSAFGPHPDNLSSATFDKAVEIVRKIIDSAKPRRAKFCLEMMQWVFPDSADCYVQLLKAVDRPAFGVHMDPVNIIVSPRQYFDTAGVLAECFARLGPNIVSCHAKDLKLRGELAMHLDEVRPGLGNLDYRAYIGGLLRLGRDVPLMLEHLSTPREYAEALAYLEAVQPM